MTAPPPHNPDALPRDALAAAPLPSAFLMCPPDFYTTSFLFNPWMRRQDPDVDPVRARDQWASLKETIQSHGADVRLLPPVPLSPPMVFTADGALVYAPDRALVLRNDGSRSFYEPDALASWFQRNGVRTESLPPAHRLDGGNLLRLSPGAYLAGLKPGSDGKAEGYVARVLERVAAARTRPLALHDRRFLHLDMVVGNLAGRGLLVYWDGLHPVSRRHLRAWTHDGGVPVVDVSLDDARRFACNAVSLAGPDGGAPAVVTGPVSDDLARRIEPLGVNLVRLDLSEFYKAGGGAKCLTLPLEYPRTGA